MNQKKNALAEYGRRFMLQQRPKSLIELMEQAEEHKVSL